MLMQYANNVQPLCFSDFEFGFQLSSDLPVYQKKNHTNRRQQDENIKVMDILYISAFLFMYS